MKKTLNIQKLLIVFALILSFPATQLHAQRIIVKNQEKYDKQWIHFGFLLGVNKTDFKMQRADDFYKSDSVMVVTTDGQIGFNLGIISNLRISNNFDLRFVPALAFSQRNINYKMAVPIGPTTNVTKKIESTFIEFPIQLKFKSNRVNNYRYHYMKYCKLKPYLLH